MLRFILLISGLVGVALSSPQWYGAPQGGYAGPHSGAAPLGPDGRVVDTPEVQALKSAHLATLAQAASRAPTGPTGYNPNGAQYGAPHNSWNGPVASYAPPSQYGSRYHGPPAPLGADGRVVDTPEVQAAKAHHFALFNAAAQQAPAGHAGPIAPYQAPHADYNDGAYNPAWDSPTYNNY